MTKKQARTISSAPSGTSSPSTCSKCEDLERMTSELQEQIDVLWANKEEQVVLLSQLTARVSALETAQQFCAKRLMTASQRADLKRLTEGGN